MLIRCQEKDCGVRINPDKDSLFDLTCGVPNCYLKQQMLAETKRRYSLAALCLVAAVAIFIVTSVLTLNCPTITHAASTLSRAARARLIFSRIPAPSAFQV